MNRCTECRTARQGFLGQFELRACGGVVVGVFGTTPGWKGRIETDFLIRESLGART